MWLQKIADSNAELTEIMQSCKVFNNFVRVNKSISNCHNAQKWTSKVSCNVLSICRSKGSIHHNFSFIISYPLSGCHFQSSHNVSLHCTFVTLSSRSFYIEPNLIFCIKCQDFVGVLRRTHDTPVPSDIWHICVDSINYIISILISSQSKKWTIEWKNNLGAETFLLIQGWMVQKNTFLPPQAREKHWLLLLPFFFSP